MKNLKHSAKHSVMTLLALITLGAVAAPAHAFNLKLVDSHDVADANYCGDFNKLTTYELSLTASERLPELEWSLLTRANLATLEQELKDRFIVPKNAQKMVLKAMGMDAIRDFAGDWSDDRDYCFGLNFSELFSYTKKNGKVTPRNPGAVTYIKLAFEQDGGKRTSTPALVVIDRGAGKLFIHQEW